MFPFDEDVAQYIKGTAMYADKIVISVTNLKSSNGWYAPEDDMWHVSIAHTGHKKTNEFTFDAMEFNQPELKFNNISNCHKLIARRK